MPGYGIIGPGQKEGERVMDSKLNDVILGNISGGADKFEKYIGPCTFYVVQEGDKLSLIAKKYNTTPEQIRFLNGMDGNKSIRVGQKLMVPNIQA